MSDNKNPFGHFNFEDVFKQIQDNPMMKAWQDSDFYQAYAKEGAQGFDFQALWEAQKKNLEHLNAMNVKIGENVKELAEKQAGMMSEAWESVKAYSENAVNNGEADVEKNMAQAQAVFQQATANIQELGKRGMEMSEDVAENLQERMKDSVQDLQNLIDKYRS